MTHGFQSTSLFTFASSGTPRGRRNGLNVADRARMGRREEGKSSGVGLKGRTPCHYCRGRWPSGYIPRYVRLWIEYLCMTALSHCPCRSLALSVSRVCVGVRVSAGRGRTSWRTHTCGTEWAAVVVARQSVWAHADSIEKCDVRYLCSPGAERTRNWTSCDYVWLLIQT